MHLKWCWYLIVEYLNLKKISSFTSATSKSANTSVFFHILELEGNSAVIKQYKITIKNNISQSAAGRSFCAPGCGTQFFRVRLYAPSSFSRSLRSPPVVSPSAHRASSVSCSSAVSSSLQRLLFITVTFIEMFSSIRQVRGHLWT